MKKKILITYRIPEEGLHDLRKHFDVYYPDMLKIPFEELSEIINDYDGVMAVFGNSFPEKILKKAKKLKIISNYGAGVDNIPVELATGMGILVTNTPDAVTESTAEHAIALMMALMRRIPECDRKLRVGDIRWGVMENLGRNLFGKTLGILGLGKIGKATAKRALSLGMKVIYYSRKRLDTMEENSLQVQHVPLEELYAQSDILSLHTPLSSETHHLVNEKAFHLMKKTVVLVNTARGAVIDEKAMIDALKHGSISGAALDVFENEPSVPKELLQMDNLVLAPHTGTATMETRIEIARIASKNIIDFFLSGRTEYPVNPEVLK